MLPLMDILEENSHIKKLNLASSGMHDARYVKANFDDFGVGNYEWIAATMHGSDATIY